MTRYEGKGSRSELALALAPYRNNAETCVTNKHLIWCTPITLFGITEIYECWIYTPKATVNSAGPAPDVNPLHPIAGHSSALLLLGRSDPKGQDP